MAPLVRFEGRLDLGRPHHVGPALGPQVDAPGVDRAAGQLVDRQGLGQGAGVAAGHRQEVGDAGEEVVGHLGLRRGLVAHEVVDLAERAVERLVIGEAGGGVDQVGGGSGAVHEDQGNIN